MKDNEFIELINLYLDHEIRPEDAARLEAAVRADPKRRELYLKYCRMQKACVAFAEQTAATAPEGVIEAFPQPRPVWIRPLWTGGLLAGAAAACAVAVLAFHRPGTALESAAPESVALTFATPASSAAPVGAKAVPQDEFSVAVAGSAPAQLTTVFTARAAVPASAGRNPDGLSPSLADPGELAWLAQANSSKALFVQPADLALAPRSAATPVDAVLAGPKSDQSQATATETTAFKIVK